MGLALDWPYHGLSALLPLWRPTKIEPHESSITSIAIAGTVDRHWYGRPGEFPPDSTNQIALGFMVHIRALVSWSIIYTTRHMHDAATKVPNRIPNVFVHAG